VRRDCRNHRGATSTEPAKALTTLAAMPANKRLAVLIAIAAIAAAGAGCGSDEIKGTIPQPNAEQLTRELDAVEVASGRGHCAAATAGAQQFLQDVNELPATSGTALKEALRGSAESLERLVQEQCAAGATGAGGQQPTGSTTKEAPAIDTTDTSGGTSTGSTSTTPTTPSEPPPSPPGGGNGNGLGNGNAGGNGNDQSRGNQGGGNTGGGSTGDTGGTGVGGG
jgi:hypothetical protein